MRKPPKKAPSRRDDVLSVRRLRTLVFNLIEAAPKRNAAVEFLRTLAQKWAKEGLAGDEPHTARAAYDLLVSHGEIIFKKLVAHDTCPERPDSGPHKYTPSCKYCGQKSPR